MFDHIWLAMVLLVLWWHATQVEKPTSVIHWYFPEQVLILLELSGTGEGHFLLVTIYSLIPVKSNMFTRGKQKDKPMPATSVQNATCSLNG